MNKDLIYQAIENPEALSQLNTADLERLTREHPWFSTAQVLLAKKYREGNDYRFTDQLHTAAMTSFNRRVLYTFLKKEKEVPAVVEAIIAPPSATIEATVTAEEIAVEPVLTATEQPQISDNLEYASDVDDLLEQQEGFFELFDNKPSAVSADNSLSELASAVMDEEPAAVAVEAKEALPELPETIEEVVVPEIVAPTPLEVKAEQASRIQIVEMDDLDRDILVTALNKSIELEVSEGQEEESSTAFTDTKADDESAVAITDPYTLWLMQRAGQLGYGGIEKAEVSEKEAEEEEEEEEEIKLTDLAPKEETQGVSHGMQRLSGSNKNSHQKDLVDRFIRLEPKITPGKALDYSGTVLGKESLEDRGGLVTETMAKLYVAQGKIDKAKKAYKRLIELFPEKSIYFATQLKNLNTKK